MNSIQILNHRAEGWINSSAIKIFMNGSWTPSFNIFYRKDNGWKSCSIQTIDQLIVAADDIRLGDYAMARLKF